MSLAQENPYKVPFLHITENEKFINVINNLPSNLEYGTYSWLIDCSVCLLHYSSFPRSAGKSYHLGLILTSIQSFFSTTYMQILQSVNSSDHENMGSFLYLKYLTLPRLYTTTTIIHMIFYCLKSITLSNKKTVYFFPNSQYSTPI